MGSTDSPFSGAVYDPETLSMLTAVFNDAWKELVADGSVQIDPDVARQWLATRIMCAAARGERDPARLKAMVLGTLPPPSA